MRSLPCQKANIICLPADAPPLYLSQFTNSRRIVARRHLMTLLASKGAAAATILSSFFPIFDSHKSDFRQASNKLHMLLAQEQGMTRTFLYAATARDADNNWVFSSLQ